MGRNGGEGIGDTTSGTVNSKVCGVVHDSLDDEGRDWGTCPTGGAEAAEMVNGTEREHEEEVLSVVVNSRVLTSVTSPGGVAFIFRLKS